MKKRYKRLIYTFEHSVEVYEYLDGKYGAPGTKRGKKRKATLEEIRFRNQWNRERKARHKLKTWFHENDYLVLFTYKKDKRPPDMETAKKHLAQAMRKVREKYKKAGKKMRWMANIEVGTKGAWHVHIVINRIPDADIIIKDSWEHGAVTFKHLYEAGDFRDLAGYITKTPETCERYGEHLRETSYHASRNMPLKEPEEERFVQWREIKDRKGYIDGDGKTGPIGIFRQIETVESAGTNKAKTVLTTVTKFSPKGLAPVRKTLTNDGKRVVDKLYLICNPSDEAEYVDPCLYGEALTGGYVNKSFIDIEKIVDANCPKGKAAFTIAGYYTMGTTGVRVNEYDQTKAMENADLIIASCYANGRAVDDNVAVIFDVTKLEEYVLPVTQTVIEKTV